MSITIKLDTEAGKTADTLANVREGLTDVKAGARSARDELDKMKQAEADQRRLAQNIQAVAAAFGNVTPMVKRHNDALAKASDVAASVAKNSGLVSSALAAASQQLDREREAAERCTQIHQELTSWTAGLGKAMRAAAADLQHQEDILKRINGPAEEYMKDLKALDELLEKNKISTEQYADQVENLNKRLGEKPKRGEGKEEHHEGGEGAREALGAIPGGGLATAAMTGGVMGIATEGVKTLVEGIEHAGEAMREQVERMREMKDTYTETANAAHKFADAGHNTNQIINDQQNLAHDLHSSLESTLETYDAVRDGTDELNLTYSEQIRLTKSLGESFILANKPLSQAGGLMARLSYDMAAGTINTRDLKTMMLEVPPIADLWTKHFNMTRTELIRAVTDGKISVKDLTQVLIDDGGKADEAFHGHVRTIGEWREEFKKSFQVARGSGKDFAMSMKEAMDKTADSSIDMATRMQAAQDLANQPYEKSIATMAAMSSQFDNVESKGEAAAANLNQAWARLAANTEKLAGKWDEVDAAAERAKVTLAMQGVLGPVTTGIQEMSHALGELGEKLNDLPLNRAMGDQQTRAHGMREARIDLEALRMEVKDGTLTWHEYENKYEELMTKLNGGELPLQIKLWHEINDQAREFHREFDALIKMNRSGALSPQQFQRGLQIVSSHRPEDPMDKFHEQIRGAELKHAQEAIRKQAEAMAKAKKEADDWSDSEREVLDVLKMIETPAEKWAEQISQIKKLHDQGKLSAEQYARAQKKIGEAMGGGSKQLTEQWFASLKEYEDQTKQANERIAQSFGPIAEAIGAMAAGAKSQWHEMIQKMLQDMTKLLVIKGLQAAFGGMGYGQSAGALGGQVMSGIFSGFDSGGQILARGTPGSTDSQLVAFRKNPNETLSINTPGQQANAAMNDGRGGGGPPVIKNVNVYDAKQAAMEALNGREGHDLLMNWVAKNASFIRGHIVK